jgi:hypothetical protein
MTETPLSHFQHCQHSHTPCYSFVNNSPAQGHRTESLYPFPYCQTPFPYCTTVHHQITKLNHFTHAHTFTPCLQQASTEMVSCTTVILSTLLHSILITISYHQGNKLNHINTAPIHISHYGPLFVSVLC